MEAAKSTIKKFTSKSGHHDTTVHEQVAPAVQHEEVQQEQHDRVHTAVDKEIHQDHYHTTEQPIQHSEVLPEQHHHKAAPVQERSFEHDDKSKVDRALQETASRYKDESHRVEGRHTETAEPVVAGEHVHHHVHETIQPVVNKQTIEPHVVHTTVPIHEVHHNESKHHGASALPAMTMDEFKQKGGALTGREERVDKFDGCPPEGIAGHEGHAGRNEGVSGGVGPGLGRESSNDYGNSASRGITGGSTGGPLNSHKHDPNMSSGHQHPQPASYGNDMHTEKTDGYNSNSKPSLMDKLNPKTDANDNGKAGVMN